MDYSKVTYVEYAEKRKKMMTSLGGYEGTCNGVPCEKCHFDKVIREIAPGLSCNDFSIKYPLETVELVMEFECIETDWSNVEVDTKILVRNSYNEIWSKRHFAKFENGVVYAFPDGTTSYSSPVLDDLVKCNQAKLYDKKDSRLL